MLLKKNQKEWFDEVYQETIEENVSLHSPDDRPDQLWSNGPPCNPLWDKPPFFEKGDLECRLG